MENIFDQCRELEERASVIEGAPEAETEEVHQFNYFCDSFKRIHAAKAVHYGDYIKTHGDETPQLFAVQHFCDIKRKYVRAKTFVERMTRGEQVDFTDLLDTYSDLAVYAIMGLQMAFHCREKMQPELEGAKYYKGPGLDVPDTNRCYHIYKDGKCIHCKHDQNLDDDIPF